MVSVKSRPLGRKVKSRLLYYGSIAAATFVVWRFVAVEPFTNVSSTVLVDLLGSQSSNAAKQAEPIGGSGFRSLPIESRAISPQRRIVEGKKRKPYLVFHIGPPKTATTSLQTDFTRLNTTLSADKYFYAGRFYYPVYDSVKKKLFPNREETPLIEMAKSMFKPNVCKKTNTADQAECVLEFKQALDPYKHLTGVLLSDEAYNGIFKSPDHYQAMRETLEDEWDVVIVVAYRRFFQWLPSDMFQRYRMDKIKGEKNWKNHWPGVAGSPGEKVGLLFPFYYKRWFEFGHRFTDYTVDNVKDTFPIRILNLHTDGQRSLRTQFLCNLLPDAPKSCEESRRRDDANDITTINDAKGALHVNYDMLTTGAADLGLIDVIHFERREIREALQNFTQVELGKSPWDFDLKCPEPYQVEEFLNMSLELEAKIFGEETAARMEDETRYAFEKDIETHIFCEVDPEATLKKEPWKSFFAQYAP
jgi:hypothetical protein